MIAHSYNRYNPQTRKSVMYYKHTDKNTGSTFKGEYCGGPVTLDFKTGKQGTQICLKSKDARYKWVEQSECETITRTEYLK